MKALISGDHHWDRSSRWEECLKVHGFMVDVAEREKVDLFVSTGDIYERASTPDERLAVAEWLDQMAELCPVLIVKGNHDQQRDCMLLSRLQTNHPVIVVESAGVHRISVGKETLAVAAVAWPERARILAQARELGTAEADTVASDALGSVLRGLGAELDLFDGPKLAVGHFMVDGSIVSTGQPLIGQAMNVGLADLAMLNADIVVMGHIHKPQDWLHGGVPYVYTGSPYRTSYGELEEKSIVLVDWNAKGGRVSWSRIPTPCARMFLIDEEWDRDILADRIGWVMGGLPPDVKGAEIRFRYAVAPDQREAARASAAEIRERLLAAGAADVQLEECVRAVTIARAPEVAAAKTLPDKLSALWLARGTMPEPARRDQLLDMARQLEEG